MKRKFLSEKFSASLVVLIGSDKISINTYKYGGQATAAELNSPTYVSKDGPGNFYIADFGNHTIRRITPAGVIRTLAGKGTSGY